MVGVKGSDKPLKGDPVAALAATDGLEGYVTRTEVVGDRTAKDKHLAERRISEILAEQSRNGSWHDTLVDTTGYVGRLLDYGCSPKHAGIRRARRWLLDRQALDHPICESLFVEPGETEKRSPHGSYLQKRYAEFHPLVPPDFCCGVNVITSTCCVLETLFRLGDDVSSNPKLALAVDRIIALGCAMNGLCAGWIVGSRPDEARAVRPRAKSWTRRDGSLFRRDCEENPGVTICAHFFMRAVSYSNELARSPFVAHAMALWQKRQLPNGNFDSRYYQYCAYFAADTLWLYRALPEAREMFERLVPRLLCRQRKDGLWRKKGEWLAPTFATILALSQFGVLEQAD